MSGRNDQAARERALDPGGSFIVQAPAGSGKTELLIQRYLTLLAHADEPEEVIAITFTRKAAAEMRERVLKSLVRARDDNPPRQDHHRLTWQLGRRVLERDAERGWSLSEHPLRLRVETIDALCAYLTARMPVRSGFGGPVSVTEQGGSLYREAAHRLIAMIEEDGEEVTLLGDLLMQLDEPANRVRQLIENLLAQRDRWLDIDLNHREGLRETLDRALARHVQEVLGRVEVLLGPFATRLGPLVHFAARNAPADSSVIEFGQPGGLPGVEPEALPQWQAVAEVLLTKAKHGTLRKTADNKLFPAKTAGAERRVFAQLAEQLAGVPGLDVLLSEVRRLPGCRYTNTQWQMLDTVFALLRLAAAQLELVFARERTVDFARVASAALEALGETEAPTELALVLDYRIRHLLVDEFQDTSHAQYDLLTRLTAGWEPGDGRTLFVVGDPMQSIYRFRNAEVGFYLRAQQSGIGNVQLERLTLSRNFRSYPSIVDWVNETIETVFPSTDDIATGAIAYTPVEATKTPDTSATVEIHPFVDAAPSDEAGRVVEIVARTCEKHPQHTTAILVRSRKHLVNVIARLRAEGTPYQAVEIDELRSRPVVLDLTALTRVLHHPGDRVAWLAVLRAPWCGLELSDLYVLGADAKWRTIKECIEDPDRQRQLSDDGRVRLQRVYPILQTALAERGTRTLRRRVEGLWLALGGPASVETEADLADAHTFLRLLDQLDASGITPSNDAIVEALDGLYAEPETTATQLQLMTIHKAKGLEFDHVILPGLEHTVGGSDEDQLVRGADFPDASGGVSQILAVRGPKGQGDRLYEFVASIQHERDYQEDRRLLYVAVTRAVRGLHLLGNVNSKSDGSLGNSVKGSFLHLLWPSLKPHFESVQKTGSGDEQAHRQDCSGLLRRVVSNWQTPEPPAAVIAPGRTQPPAPVEFVWARPMAAHVGTVVHRALQKIASVGFARWQREDRESLYRQQLRSLGTADADLDTATRRVAESVEAAITDPRGQWILQDGHRDSVCELPLSGWLDGELVHGVIDRSFVDDDGVRWIIDYKTSRHEGGQLEEFLDNEQIRYSEQMARYARLMSRWRKEPIRLGLYFPLLSGWREWG